MIPYIISSFRGGVSDESDKGIAGSFKHGYGLDIHSRDDVLQCASTIATIDSTVVSSLITTMVTARDGSTYCFSDTGSVFAISGSVDDPVTTLVYNDENGKIRGAAEWKLSDGNNYIYWATNTSVARMILNGSGDTPWAAGVVTQDYKTTLDAADWHTMKNAGGVLNIANGNFNATIDYDGAFDPADLNIRPGNLIKAIEERDDYVILGSERRDFSEEGHIWSWITSAVNWVQKKRIPAQGVNSIITGENMLLQGGDDGEIFYSDFVNAIVVHAVPGGGKTNPGGVAIENDLALFGMYGGTYPGLWRYGRRGKNRASVLDYPYRLAPTVAGSSVSTIGAVAVVNGLALASWGTTDGSTSDYGVDMVSSTTRATAVYEGLEFNAGAPHLKKTHESVKAITTPLPSGTSYSIKFKHDKETDWRYAVLGNGATTYSTTNSTESEWTIGKPGHTYEVGAELNSSGSSTPQIQSIITYISNEQSDHG